eukprot:XP_011667198.1 PREDICTED: uncharacterized protein LOC105439665 [Strongylocentrotus purpuratus]
MEFINDLWRLLVMFTCLMCAVPPTAASDDECLPYCIITLATNTTKVDIKTPGYPSNYPQDTKLLWIIGAPSNYGLLLTVHDLELATGDTVQFGHRDEAKFIIEIDDDVEAMINRTISFAKEEVTWVTFSSDNDNATARGIWLTVTADLDASESPYTSSTTTTLPTELPLVSLLPSSYRRLGVSLPLAIGLIIIAFGLGAVVVWCYRKRKRTSVDSRVSETRIALEMCSNPMKNAEEDENLNTHHGSSVLGPTRHGPTGSGLGPQSYYCEIGEAEYNVLFDASGPKTAHVYQELLKNPRIKDGRRNGSNVRRDGSKGSLSAELDIEFCELTSMIDDMLGDISDEAFPVAASQSSLVGGSPKGSGLQGTVAEQRSRAHTAYVPRSRRSPVRRPNSLLVEPVYPLPKANNFSSPRRPARKYAVSNPNINAVNVKLKPARSVGSLPTFLGQNVNDDDNYSQLNFEIDPTYQPLMRTSTIAQATKSSHEQRSKMPEYAVLDRDNPEHVSPVYSLTVSNDGSWEKLDIVELPTRQRPRAYTSDLPRRSDHYTALRSTSLFNQPALDRRLARSNPNLNSVGIQLLNNLCKSSESLNKLSPGFRDGLPSFATGGCIKEDPGDDDDDYSEIDDEESIYQPLSRPTSMVDLVTPDDEGTTPSLPQIADEMNEKSGQGRRAVDVVFGRGNTDVGSFSLAYKTGDDDDDDDDEYNEIGGEYSTYQPLSRPTSMEDQANGWSLGREATPPPLPPMQYEINEKRCQTRPSVDVVLGRELTTVGSFQLVSTARRSVKIASACTLQSSQSDDNDYDELDMENSAELPTYTNPGSLYIDIFDENQDAPSSVGTKHITGSGTRESHQVLSSDDTRVPRDHTEAPGTRNSQDASGRNGGIGLGNGQPTEGAVQHESASQNTCVSMINSNRLSTTSGVYSSIGPAVYGFDIDNGEGIYNAIGGYSSDDDDDVHEYISVNDVLP